MRRQRTARVANRGEESTVPAVANENNPSNEDEARIVPPFSREQLEGLKRKDLQALCKTHNIRSSGKNAELVEKLLEINANYNYMEGVRVDGAQVVTGFKQTCDTLVDDESHLRRASMSLRATPAKIGNTPRTPSVPAAGMDRRTPARPIVTPKEATPAATRVTESLTTLTPKTTINAPEVVLGTVTKENQSSPNKPDDRRKSRNLTKGMAPPSATISHLPVVKKRAKVSAGDGDDAVSGVAPLIAMTRPVGKVSTAPVKRRFDLKESLKKPLSYKPHTGPLKPFSML